MQQKPQAVARAKLITVYINKNNPKPEQFSSSACLDYTEFKEMIQ